jgi:hypothetical protein
MYWHGSTLLTSARQEGRLISNTNIYSEFHKLGDKVCLILVQRNYTAEIKQSVVDAMWHAMGYENYI